MSAFAPLGAPDSFTTVCSTPVSSATCAPGLATVALQQTKEGQLP